MISIDDRIKFYKGALLRDNKKFKINYKNSDEFIEYNNLKKIGRAHV